jgi:hypothetical protein
VHKVKAGSLDEIFGDEIFWMQYLGKYWEVILG